MSQATGWTTTGQVSRSNWGILDSGVSDHYAILKPGAFRRARISLAGGAGANMTVEEIFTGIIEVWQLYTDETTTQANLESAMNNMMNRLDAYRKLADTTGAVRDAFSESGGEQREGWVKGGDGPVWIIQDITVSWTEEKTVALAE